ncbi:MAG TPA: RDD family protein [Burkholderiales bacterium]
MTDAATPSTPQYVGFWKRLFAFFIDSLIVVIVLLPVMIALYGGGYLGRLGSEFATLLISSGDPNADLARNLDILSRSDSAIVALLDIKVQIGLIVATIVFWRFRGATPGKMLIRAKIAKAGTLGKPSTAQLTGRFFAYLVSFIPACLGFLWIAFDKRKQGWHDKLAGTVVIQDEDDG